MVTVLLSWLAIGTASLIFGKAIVDRIYRDDLDTMGKVDIYFMVGIIFLNIYAQIFSLFYKVGEAACIILFVAGVILTGKCIVRCIRERRSPVSFGFLKEHPYRLILIGGGCAEPLHGCCRRQRIPIPDCIMHRLFDGLRNMALSRD